jgi:hypothetical protein
MATIAEVTHTPYPANWPGRELLPLEGESLRPHFSSATEDSFPERSIGFEHEANRAWFKGDYKFVTKNFAALDGSSPQDELELYDMSTDPTELNNLALEEPELLSEMVAEWNAWAQRVGVPNNRLILPPPQVDPAPMEGDLFLDTFNRENSPDHDASAEGMSGLLVPPLSADLTYVDSWEAGSTEISSKRLRMAGGPGMSETSLRHNFVNSDILAAGGFSIQLRLDRIDSVATDLTNRYGGIAVGLSATEAENSEDIGASGPPTSFRGNENNGAGTADFFIEIDLSGNLKTWSNGTLLGETPVGQTDGTLTVCYQCGSFDANAPVEVSAFLDGVAVDLDSATAATNQTFTWDQTDTNYIGLSARASESVLFDNLAIRLLPLRSALASAYALTHGLSGNDAALTADADADGLNNYQEWLQASSPNEGGTSNRLLMVTPSSNRALRFHYPKLREAAKAGVEYTFRYSTDLSAPKDTWTTFTPEELTIETLGSAHELHFAQLPNTLFAANTRLFIAIEAN